MSKNTDTVPAMLTPGEFVVRKEAVNELGLPFLEELNSIGSQETGHSSIDELIALANMPEDSARVYEPGTSVGAVDSNAVMMKRLKQIGTDRDYRNLLKQRYGEELGGVHIKDRMESGDMLNQDKINEVLEYFMRQRANQSSKDVQEFQYGGPVTGGRDLFRIIWYFWRTTD